MENSHDDDEAGVVLRRKTIETYVHSETDIDYNNINCLKLNSQKDKALANIPDIVFARHLGRGKNHLDLRKARVPTVGCNCPEEKYLTTTWRRRTKRESRRKKHLRPVAAGEKK